MNQELKILATPKPGDQKSKKPRKPELLAPAGSPEKLEYALAYGADAVYLSGKEFGLRKNAGNFSLEEINKAVQLTHKENKKIYVTVNIFARNKDFFKLGGYLKELSKMSIDAIIVADPGVFNLARDIVPEVPVHLSTQANTLNIKSVEFWAKQGVTRVTLARELSLEEIKQIKAKSHVEIEVLVHGAMCISYSGRCLLSKYLANRDANSGDCAQSCRWKYAVVEEKREGEFFPLEEDSSGTYIFNSKDLCLLRRIPQLIEAGIDSFKIEGRMRSIHYLATTTKIYRKAVDAYFDNPNSFILKPQWEEELEKIPHRPYTIGFLEGSSSQKEAVESSANIGTHEFVGIVDEKLKDGKVRVKLKSSLEVPEVIEILQPEGKNVILNIDKMLDSEGLIEVKKASENDQVTIFVGKKIEKYSILRRKRVNKCINL